MIDRVLAFDRSLKTISIGSCGPFPVNALMPILQEQLSGKTISTELVSSDERLLSGLRSHLYQLVVLHEYPEDKELFCQRYLDEQLYITLPKDHPLAKQDSVCFEDLKGMRILMTAHVGFWMDITLQKLSASDLLIQNSMARDSHLDTHFPRPFALLRSGTYPLSCPFALLAPGTYPLVFAFAGTYQQAGIYNDEAIFLIFSITSLS